MTERQNRHDLAITRVNGLSKLVKNALFASSFALLPRTKLRPAKTL
ncbi:hypothetical protein [Thioclava sp. SK-1]|nr:hypothetical protein [Thioclava sp. SK-1]